MSLSPDDRPTRTRYRLTVEFRDAPAVELDDDYDDLCVDEALRDLARHGVTYATPTGWTWIPPRSIKRIAIERIADHA